MRVRVRKRGGRGGTGTDGCADVRTCGRADVRTCGRAGGRGRTGAGGGRNTALIKLLQ